MTLSYDVIRLRCHSRGVCMCVCVRVCVHNVGCVGVGVCVGVFSGH